METIGAIFRAIAEALGLVKQRGAQNNTPAMVQAKTAQNEVNKEDEINKDVGKGNLDDIRKLGAE